MDLKELDELIGNVNAVARTVSDCERQYTWSARSVLD